nr:hypothetical protein [Tanacetum cinerariifolium]
MTSTTNKSCHSWQKRSTKKTTRCADKADLRWELESKFADARGNSVLSVRVMRKKKEIQRRPSPIASSRDTRFSQGTSVFSRLKHDKEKPACQRSPVSTTVFTRIGEWDATDRVKRAKHARTEETYLSKNEHDRGGHWKSISKKQKTSEEEDLS